jgi:methionyl-tRNA formyltransferase
LRRSRVLFIGNRTHALSEIFSGLDSEPILAIQKGSYAHRELADQGRQVRLFDTRQELADIIRSSEFDLLISEGCRFIIPVSQIRKAGQLFLNLHPAILPDHRGPIPVISAMYYYRNAGATCHVMTDRLDVGPYVAQVPIELSPSINLELLYQLSFRAEAKALGIAIKRNFSEVPGIASLPWREEVFTSKDAEKLKEIRLDMSAAEIVARVRALSIGSRFAKMKVNDRERMIQFTRPLEENTMNASYPNANRAEIADAFGDALIVQSQDGWLALDLVPDHAGKAAV